MMKKLFLCLSIILIALLTSCSRGPSASNTSTPAANHIALLVPLSGPLAPYGTAIRNGFFTAYYTQKEQTGAVPTINVIDSNGQPIQTAYQIAVASGANMVVGPLDKNDVSTLAQMKLSVPVLALNRTTNAHNGALFEFALSPTDEAEQAALKASSDHHHAILILVPQTPVGQRMAAAFTDTWKKTGGTIVATSYYNDISTLSQNITDVLQITQGRNEAKSLEKILHQDVRYQAQRRQDFDSVFLVANATMAKQIQLLLQFYFVNAPIYATSQIYNGNVTPGLNNIQFCDMPWILAPSQMSASLQSMQQKIQMMWPDNYARLAKFYAMGVDAYDLVPQLSAMASNNTYNVPAATGVLSLSTDHQIHRQLTWATLQNGVPVV